MVKGIYKITNNRSGEVYIGQSTDIESRKNTHFKELEQRKHHNSGMQNDYSSGDSFSFEILLEMPNATREELHDKEKYYISKYNSFWKGYNQTPGGEMDKYKGRYKYGGRRLPKNEYRTPMEYKIPPNTNDKSLELEKNKSRITNLKIILTGSVVVTIISLIVYFWQIYLFGEFYTLNGLFAVISASITIIFSIELISKKSHVNKLAYDIKENEMISERNNEINRLIGILNENSMYLENEIIERVVSLSSDKKQIFCRTYNIQNTNENIIKFIAKTKWIGIPLNHPYSEIVNINNISKDKIGLIQTLNALAYKLPDPNYYYFCLSRNIPEQYIHNVLIRDNYICQKCGKNLLEYETYEELTRDNDYVQLIKPLEEGGTIIEDNLITACKQSCDNHYIPSKDIIEIKNTPSPNSNQNLTRIERNGVSFKFPDYYLVDKIPENCRECIVSLTKDDGKCNILIEMDEELKHIASNYLRYTEELTKKRNSLNIFTYHMLDPSSRYVNELYNFCDIQRIEFIKSTEIWNTLKYRKRYCFIATYNDSEGNSNKKKIIKSIIFFDLNHLAPIKITLNSPLDEKYNCIQDLYFIVNSLKIDAASILFKK